MKSLFVVQQTIDTTKGISKKISAQYDALVQSGCDIKLCSFDIVNGDTYLIVGDKIIKKIGSGLLFKINYWLFLYDVLAKYIIKQEVKFVYFRYTGNATPCFLNFLNMLKKEKIIIFLEIPTYPYDGEIVKFNFLSFIQYSLEKKLRKQFKKYISRIVTFSDDNCIFNIPTIRIANGIDLKSVNISNHMRSPNRIVFLGVAMYSFWHGYDRFIQGLYDYLKRDNALNIEFLIVGEGGGDGSDFRKIKVQVFQLGLANNVKFLGKLSGPQLDRVFDSADICVGCLGCHRKNIKKLRSLKNVEYAARGIPFIYSEDSDDFDSQPYVYKILPDESNVDISAVCKWYDNLNISSDKIRSSVFELSWDKQMKLVLDEAIELSSL